MTFEPGAREPSTAPPDEVFSILGNEVVVIERDQARADRVADEHDCLVLNADATIKENLEDAGASRADAIISTSSASVGRRGCPRTWHRGGSARYSNGAGT